MIFYALGYSAVYCTFKSRHVNIGALENRFHVICKSWRPGRRQSPIFGPALPKGVGCVDNSRCGRDHGVFEFPGCEPTNEQRDSFVEWDTAHEFPNTIMLYCLRPLELYGFHLPQWAEWVVPASNAKNLQKYNWENRRIHVLHRSKYGLSDLRYGRMYLHWEIFVTSNI